VVCEKAVGRRVTPGIFQFLPRGGEGARAERNTMRMQPVEVRSIDEMLKCGASMKC
jgi:hypothetical protein